MSKKAFKEQLKIDASNKIPNVLAKIDLNKIEIKEAEVVRVNKYRQPALRLAYALSLVLVVALLVGVLMIGTKQTPIYAKEDEAIMIAVIQAYTTDDSSVNSDKDITISNSNLLFDIDQNNLLLEEIGEELNKFLESVEISLFQRSISRKQLSELSGYEQHLSFKSKRLNGKDMSLKMAYNTTKKASESTIDGKLYINEEEVTFSGTITTEDGIEVITIKKGERSIKTWIKDDVRVFEITKITPLLQIKRTQIRSYMNNSTQVVEIIPEVDPIGNLFKKRIIFTKEKLENSDVLSVEMIDESNLFQFINNIKITITATDENEQTKYHYRFYGKLKIGQITHDHEFNYYYNQKKRNSK